MKLHYGALGSLGVIVAASFKVFPRPLRDVTVTSDGGWDDAERALAAPLPPSALEVFSEGRVLARYMGSRDAVERVVNELGWHSEEASIWERHASRGPARWARIAAPRTELRRIVESLPRGAGWWASPGLGVAHWAIASDADSVRAMRRTVEAAGGALVMMSGPDEFMRDVGAWGTPPETIEIMRRLKRAFDPDGVLNPGRFVV
jgi:glycolate dehydrogenase FAD-binding subunit